MTRLLLALAAALPLAARAQPLTLDDALGLAARQSHDLVLARADADLAGADATAALSGALPRLDLTSSFGRRFTGPRLDVTPVPLFDPTTGAVIGFDQKVVTTASSSAESYALNLTLTAPLVDLGAWRQIAQARAASRAAARGYDESRLAVAFDVTRRFYELLKAERSLQVLEKAARRSEELVERADALFAAGRAQKSDTYNARVNLGNDRIAVEQGRSRVVQARADLATALGQPGDAAVEVVPPATVEGPGLPSGEPPPLAELVATARTRRPSLAAAQARVEAADEGIGAAQAGWLPTLAAQATYGRAGPQLTGQDGVYGDPSRQYSATAALVLSWNLFQGRLTVANVQRAEAGAARARATAARTGDAVASEIANARQGVLALSRQVALSADNLAAAEQGLSLATQRLEAGLASQLEVRDATLKLTQAELSLVQARIDHAVAAADLNRAVGGAL
ncbi:MAG TPA: TolC family protein [Anaeromyxobacteraceae bacterium]|nr:TolC family protein [Anaeromyxobacteraceae bacterium]